MDSSYREGIKPQIQYIIGGTAQQEVSCHSESIRGGVSIHTATNKIYKTGKSTKRKVIARDRYCVTIDKYIDNKDHKFGTDKTNKDNFGITKVSVDECENGLNSCGINWKEKMCSKEEMQEILKKREEVARRGRERREQLKRRVQMMTKVKEKTAKEEMKNRIIEQMLQETNEVEEKILEESSESEDDYMREIDQLKIVGKPKVHFMDEFKLRSPEDDVTMKINMDVAVQSVVKKIDRPTKSFAVTYYFSPEGIKRTVYSGWAEKLKEISIRARIYTSWRVSILARMKEHS